jgi:hypothetical protein
MAKIPSFYTPQEISAAFRGAQDNESYSDELSHRNRAKREVNAIIRGNASKYNCYNKKSRQS